MTATVINLVADIGGTNLRIGYFVNEGSTSVPAEVINLQVFQCQQYASLAEVLQTYLKQQGIENNTINACLAIACPVEDDLISMTNLPWEFSQSALKAQLNFNALYLINDYTAIAHAVPLLNDQQKIQIGSGLVVKEKPMAICGPGTGLGVANVVFSEGKCISLGGEGGHVDFAPTDATEIKILEFLLTKYQHVSYEQLLSGLGLKQIYQAVCHINGEKPEDLTAQKISENALSASCITCEQALAQFCKVLGSFAGNLALTIASFGGVYIAGGIVPRFIQYLENSEFRARFEAKGRFNDFNRSIATFVITEPQPGILGASAFLSQQILKEQPLYTNETVTL
ncbi:MAG: glucokinase [Colwellia sp.]|nr:glucokinase [Colwellia sp.]